MLRQSPSKVKEKHLLLDVWKSILVQSRSSERDRTQCCSHSPQGCRKERINVMLGSGHAVYSSLSSRVSRSPTRRKK